MRKINYPTTLAYIVKFMPFMIIGARARKQAIEKVENNIKWLQLHEENIFSQLREMSF